MHFGEVPCPTSKSGRADWCHRWLDSTVFTVFYKYFFKQGQLIASGFSSTTFHYLVLLNLAYLIGEGFSRDIFYERLNRNSSVSHLKRIFWKRRIGCLMVSSIFALPIKRGGPVSFSVTSQSDTWEPWKRNGSSIVSSERLLCRISHRRSIPASAESPGTDYRPSWQTADFFFFLPFALPLSVDGCWPDEYQVNFIRPCSAN